MNLTSAKIWFEVQAIKLRKLVRIPVFLASVAVFLFSFYVFLSHEPAYFGYELPRVAFGGFSLKPVPSRVAIGFGGMLLSAFLAYKAS